jgi:hypothetical protein
MLTSCKEGLRTPYKAAAVIGFTFMLATLPSYSMRIPLTAVSVSWPANEPSSSASLTNGVSRGASSAEIDGKFSALVISPVLS